MFDHYFPKYFNRIICGLVLLRRTDECIFILVLMLMYEQFEKHSGTVVVIYVYCVNLADSQFRGSEKKVYI